MKIPELRPILWNENLEETISFYVDFLGFACFVRNDDRG